MRAHLSFLGLPLVALLGCPAEVKDTQAAPRPKAEATPQVDESDPRVVKVGEDLYAADAVPVPPEASQGKGTGKPDESNGFCRLYAPKLPDPHCCLSEYGFDAENTAEACGKSLYLGESFQRSCGYFFHDNESGTPVWFRTAFVDDPTPKDAAETEARRLEARFGGKVPVTPMKDTPDAYTLSYNGISYAYVSGDPEWPNLRRLAWNEQSCDEEGIEKVVAQLATAKAPPKGAERQGLIPKAR